VLLRQQTKQRLIDNLTVHLGRVKLLPVALPFYLTELRKVGAYHGKSCFLVLTVIREIFTLLAILHLDIAKKPFLLPVALSNLTRPWCSDQSSMKQLTSGANGTRPI